MRMVVRILWDVPAIWICRNNTSVQYDVLPLASDYSETIPSECPLGIALLLTIMSGCIPFLVKGISTAGNNMPMVPF